MDRTIRKTTQVDTEGFEAGLGCAAGILLLVMVPVWSLYDAWAVRVFWSWYITPGWGVPVPSYLAVVGASMLIGFYKRSIATGKEGKPWKEIIWSAWTTALIGPLIFLAFAWLIKVALFH